MLNIDVINRDWQEHALCAGHPDPDLWWYEHKWHADEQRLQILRIAEALEICADCPVKNQCLQQGLEDDNMISGSVFGGATYYERLKLVNKFVGKGQRSDIWITKGARKVMRERNAKRS